MKRLLIAIAACGAPAGPATISQTTPAFAGQTCALAAPHRTPVHDLRFEQWLGRVGDRSWMLGERDHHHVLVTLANDGTLAVTPLPGDSHDKVTATVDGTHLWLDRELPGPTNHEVLFALDLTTARPAIPPGEELAGKTLAGTYSFGISRTRMLAFSFAAFGVGPGFQLVDRERHVALATMQFQTYGIEEPPIRCVVGCFGLTHPNAAGGSLAAQVFAPDGTATSEPLSRDDRIEDAKLVALGDRTLVVWDGFSRQGLFGRVLDANGHPAGAEVTLNPGHASDVEIVPGPRSALAYRDAKGWALARLAEDGHALEAEQRIGFPHASFVTAAQTTDGTLVMVFTSDVSIDTPVPPTTASAVFVPATGTPSAPIDVMFGERHVSWAPFPLVAPGFAAGLVLEQGEGDPNGELVMLRRPCR